MALLGTAAFAQTSQGTVSVQGSVNFTQNANKYDDTANRPDNNKDLYIRLSPSIGYFVTDGLELGLGIGVMRNVSRYMSESDESKSKTQSINFSPYIRKYVALTDQLHLHGTGFMSVGFANRKYKEDEDASYEMREKSNEYSIGLYPGITYFATPKLGITATFGSLSYFRNEDTPLNNPHSSATSISNGFAVNLSPSSVNLGIGYYIGR